MMAALALTFAACSNDDNEFAQQPDNNEITITATVSSDDDPRPEHRRKQHRLDVGS